MFLSQVLMGEQVGLLPIDESSYEIYYRHLRLGYLDERTMRAVNVKPQTPTAPDDDASGENNE